MQSWLQSEIIKSSRLRHFQFRRFYVGIASTGFGYTTQATSAAWLMATPGQSHEREWAA